MKRDLYLFTDGFPFGRGEKTFIMPELSYFRERFHVTVVAYIWDPAVLKDSNLKTSLPDDIDLIVYSAPCKMKLISRALVMLLDPMGWRELLALRADGISVRRLIDSVKSYAAARDFALFLRKSGLIDHSSNAIYYTFWFSTATLALAFLQKSLPLPVISRANGYELFNEVQRNGRQPFQRIKRNACNKLLFVSNQGRDYFTRHFGEEIAEGQYCINYLGVKRRVSDEEVGVSRRGEDFLLVSCSNVIPLKRVDLIAKALCLLTNLNVKWVHFGAGQELDSIRAFAKNKKLNAVLDGAVPNEAVMTYYREHQVSCFISTSSSEGGSPVSIQEALSFGVPVIGANVGGVPECIDGNGILLSANPTVQEVADAIRFVHDASGAEWRRMAQRSYELWRERFELDHNKRVLLEMMETL